MNLKQMAALREVILTGSVSEAARNLNRTQPSISHMIATLEDELNMKLFERRGGRLHPVPEAEYLYREADEVLRRVGSINQTMKRIKAMEAGELRIVSMPGPAAVLLPRLICDHLGPHPDVKVTLLTRSSDAVVQLVGSQQFDIGVADHDPNREIEAALLRAQTFDFDCLCAVSANSPLARHDQLSPKELCEHPIAALFQEHSSYLATRRAFDAQGRDMNIRFVGQFFLPLLTYVEAGLAALVLDPLTAESWKLSARNPDAVVFRRFRPKVVFRVDVLTPAYTPESLLARAFAQHLADFFRSRSRGGHSRLSLAAKRAKASSSK